MLRFIIGQFFNRKFQPKDVISRFRRLSLDAMARGAGRRISRFTDNPPSPLDYCFNFACGHVVIHFCQFKLIVQAGLLSSAMQRNLETPPRCLGHLPPHTYPFQMCSSFVVCTLRSPVTLFGIISLPSIFTKLVCRPAQITHNTPIFWYMLVSVS